MPQCDLKYSDDLPLDAPALLRTIEEVIFNHDPDAGACKGRAMPVAQFHRSHLLACIGLMPRAHRDAAFMRALQTDLMACLRAALPQGGVWVSLRLEFLPETYSSEQLP